jgi:prepilin-type N-terminal cleavage/methylation domain-containing protein
MKFSMDGFRKFRSANKGFTLIELMTTSAIVSIGVALALPAFAPITEKRQLTAAAEEIAGFLTIAQTEAIKRNEQVTVSWYTPGSHSNQWCIGVTEGGAACDCRETVASEDDFCAIDGNAYRLVQTDFVDMNFEFMHMNPVAGNFAFDPVRGIMTDISSTEIIDDDYLFYVHSNNGSGSTRDYELEIRASITGRVSICTDTSRKSVVGGYTEC